VIYWVGVIISAILFLLQLFRLSRLIPDKTKINNATKINVVEIPDTDVTFSFFNYIFIGNFKDLSAPEKQRIIEHESTHIRQWHSLDIILISVLKIVFWFNPLVNIYKKIFVQLHEFEADARAVENQDVNNYCSLLARVALGSAGLSIANHFNNSLTIKRIQMMRTIKSNIKWWKLAVFASIIPLMFFFLACQDQIISQENDLKYLPVEVRDRFSTFQQKYPGETFIVEYDDNADKKLTELENKFGKAAHIELFTITDENKQRTFSMLQYVTDKNTSDHTPISASNEIFEVVDQMPEFENGFEGLISFLQENVKYPLTARSENIEGTSMISFIVEKDGTISDVKVLREFNASCDVESKRVVTLMPKWKPGKQNGEFVRTRMTLPIKFKL
jgi:TonB family protein